MRMIDAASVTIESYCSRVFLSASYTETRDGTGNRKLCLDNFPVTSVTAVTVNGQSIPPRPSAIGYGFTFDDLVVKLTGYRFEQGLDNVVIQYVAGLPAVPDDIDMACCEAVTLRYKSLDRLGVSSKSLAGESISFSTSDFSESVRRVLDQYRMLHLS